MTPIPRFVIEYFLLGRTRRESIERFLQDGGIVTDVWLAFAANRSIPQRVLVAPSQKSSAVEVGYFLHKRITSYRNKYRDPDPLASNKESPGISPLENYVSVKLYFDELIRIVLPLTNWWHRKHLNAIRHADDLKAKLESAILGKLQSGNEKREIESRKSGAGSNDPLAERGVIEAAPVAALIGLFLASDDDPDFFKDIEDLDMRKPGDEITFHKWINRNAKKIASAVTRGLSQYLDDVLPQKGDQALLKQPDSDADASEPPELIQRVFIDRNATLADNEGNATVKADAATRVFDISCKSITWAIIDSGIATTHPAFMDHDARDKRGDLLDRQPTRIRKTLDFTCIEHIRNFDLTADDEDSDERATAIAAVVKRLKEIPGRTSDPGFAKLAKKNLEAIARQLEQSIPPDWNLIEPLIQLGDTDEGTELVSDHGTHVAGILGADWRNEDVGADGQKTIRLQGVCPDINLYDLRVIETTSKQSTEFALLAALEYVQFVNARAASNGPVIHGVNVSMSIPHEVRSYGCGATPVCVACDRLVGAGVVVVAAAGNRGWNEAETGFGNFVFCSVTDPGNARDVITVGSTHKSRPHAYGVSYFSSRGPTGDGRIKPDLVAPGERIRGPIRGDADEELDGTSMAAPFVSGAAAMLIARNRELINKPARVKQILCDSATDLGREKYFQGFGLVDVLRALQSL